MNGSRLGVFLGGLVERLLAMAAGSVAARAESDAAIAEADCLDRIEEAARRYDEAGKPHLAERLRRRGAGVSADNPGGMAARLLAGPSSAPLSTPALGVAPPEAPTEEKPVKRRRRRQQAAEGDE